MLTLYYSPGACSMASHIALEETGAAYTPQPVLIPKGEHQSPEYLKTVNPRGKVPALKTDDGILTENVAILTYLARTFPDAKLLPIDPLGTARALSHMAYLSNTVHPAFTHIMRPGRFAAAARRGSEAAAPPPTTALGALLRHITGGADTTSFQPMNVNFGLFPPLSPDPGRHADRKPLMARRALADLDAWLGEREPSR